MQFHPDKNPNNKQHQINYKMIQNSAFNNKLTKSLVLVGMMGTGKSTIGKEVAKKLKIKSNTDKHKQNNYKMIQNSSFNNKLTKK